MKKLITPLIAIVAAAILIWIAIGVCKKLDTANIALTEQIISLEAQRDSVKTLYAQLDEEYLLVKELLSESEQRVEAIKKERLQVEIRLRRQIAELNTKTPEETYELFNETFPTPLKGPTHTIVSDQARQAVEAKIELECVKEELGMADTHITELNRIISLQAQAIDNRDEKIVLQQREISLMDERHKAIIVMYEDEISRRQKRQTRERIGFVGSIGALVVLMIIK